MHKFLVHINKRLYCVHFPPRNVYMYMYVYTGTHTYMYVHVHVEYDVYIIMYM